MKPVTAYLVFYNIASALGWLYVLVGTISSKYSLKADIYSIELVANDAPDVWGKIGPVLQVVQTTACLELLHSILGWVRSPIFTVFIQVGSRILVLWFHTSAWAECQTLSTLPMMLVAWAVTEVVRYSFYTCGCLMPSEKIPFPLFYLRYSLFLVLYPTGITGELFQAYESIPRWYALSPVMYRVLLALHFFYIPGTPFLISNMWFNRKSSFRKRKEAGSPRPVDGLVWPITNSATGERSTTTTGKAILAKVMEGRDDAASKAINEENNFRFGYIPHMVKQVEYMLANGSDATVQMCQAGLDEAHARFQFVRGGKVLGSFAEMFAPSRLSEFSDAFGTGFVKGTKPKPPNFDLVVPYQGKLGEPYYEHKPRGDPQTITRDELKSQLKQWVDAGTIEKSAADAIEQVQANPAWLDLSDRYFVLLGATSAMGPLDILLAHGANIIAIDIDREGPWKTLIAKARASCGSLTFPTALPLAQSGDAGAKYDAAMAKIGGANLLTHAPEIANWLMSVCPGKQLTIGNYTYLDGALHVQLALACDAIINAVCNKRKDTAIAFLCTPTDIHVCSKEAVDGARNNLQSAPWWAKLISSISPSNILSSNVAAPVKDKVSKTELHYVQGLVNAQGPNYCIAKRMQHWRAVVARAAGHIVSSNVAPSTATLSVVHNSQFAAAYGGFHNFVPFEVMYQYTSGAVMFALLMHDLCNKKSAANPATKLNNPLELFKHGSFHGGVWRCGYKVDSIGETSACLYWLSVYGNQIFVVLAILVAAINWVATGRTLLSN